MTTYSEKIRELQKRILFDFNEDEYDTYFQLGTMLFDIGMCKEALDQFNTALYIYAHTGKIPEGYDEETMTHAFEPEKKFRIT